MIVVSDASPLHYLILIEQAKLLPKLFTSVVIPPKVLEELTRPKSPVAVQAWLEAPPSWLSVQAPSVKLADSRIDPGEGEAIALACEIHADAIHVDDRDGVRFAKENGLLVIGTLGVLVSAARKNLVSLKDALSSLEKTNFRRSSTLFTDLLRQ